MKKKWNELITEMKAGSELALSRLITRVENREPGWMEAMQEIYSGTGQARLIGITGSPGAGKSTLTNQIARALVERGNQVGVIAVDPSSPFTGGAILGDRIRMTDVSEMEKVFVRSMATRGTLGGLNQSARDVAKIMDAFGKDYILIETVGVGQDEVEVVKTADLVMVVCVPGQGDGIQAIKAGIMEIADLFVVNKADREGANRVVSDIGSMLALGQRTDAPKPLIVKTVATEGKGISELVDQALDLLNSLDRTDKWQHERIQEELIGLVKKEVVDLIKRNWNEEGALEDAVKRVINREADPYSIVREVLAPLDRFLKKH
jgi:LAO/AO transport system kinase